MLNEIVHRVDRAVGGKRISQAVLGLGVRQQPQHILNDRIEQFAIRDAIDVVAKSRICPKLRSSQYQITEPMPFALGLDRQNQLSAVGTDKRSVRRDTRMRQSRALCPSGKRA